MYIWIIFRVYFDFNVIIFGIKEICISNKVVCIYIIIFVVIDVFEIKFGGIIKI